MFIRLILTVTFVFLSPYAFGSGHLPSTAVEGVMVGQWAPEFTLETISGVHQSLNQARGGQRTILFFWATWCPHCHTELENIRLHLQETKAKGIQILLVDVGESKEDVQAYLARRSLGLDSFLDEDNTVAGQYGVIGIPTLFFIDEKGIIRSIRHEFPFDYETEFAK